MSTILQIELSHYITNHGNDCVLQDNGVALLSPVVQPNDSVVYQWDYVETYRQAREVLGY